MQGVRIRKALDPLVEPPPPGAFPLPEVKTHSRGLPAGMLLSSRAAAPAPRRLFEGHNRRHSEGLFPPFGVGVLTGWERRAPVSDVLYAGGESCSRGEEVAGVVTFCRY